MLSRKQQKWLWDASAVYAPTMPRQASNASKVQSPSDTRAALVASLRAAAENGMPGYYSVYSFPRGHSKEGNIPEVDCIFVDFDVTKEHYRPDEGRDSFDDWKRDMSALLARTRMVAQALIDAGAAQHFRVVLSGHKGIHLYLDFSAIAPENGSFMQFKNGLKSYGDDVVQWMDKEAGGVNILPWVDVDASDLGRLARHPNTPHHGVQWSDGEREHWCVPVTMHELANLYVEDYLDLTAAPRPMTDEMKRVPSERAGREVTQKIRTAHASKSRANGGGASRYDPELVAQYKDSVNEDIELEDLLDPLIMGNKPCIMKFRERDDAYQHGQASRAMELNIMGHFIQMRVPIDVMHEFFEVIPGYSERYTQELIEDLIGRGETGYRAFNCQSIAGGYRNGQTVSGQAPQFCCGTKCKLYRKNDDIQIHDRTHPDA